MSQLITALPAAPVVRPTDYVPIIVPNVITVSAAADATINGTAYAFSAANGDYELAADGRYYNNAAAEWYLAKVVINGAVTYVIGHTAYGYVWSCADVGGTYTRIATAWPADVTDVNASSTTGLYEQTCKATAAQMKQAICKNIIVLLDNSDSPTHSARTVILNETEKPNILFFDEVSTGVYVSYGLGDFFDPAKTFVTFTLDAGAVGTERYAGVSIDGSGHIVLKIYNASGSLVHGFKGMLKMEIYP